MCLHQPPYYLPHSSLCMPAWGYKVSYSYLKGYIRNWDCCKMGNFHQKSHPWHSQMPSDFMETLLSFIHSQHHFWPSVKELEKAYFWSNPNSRKWMSVKISSYFGRYRDHLFCDVPSKNFSDIFLSVMLNIFLILAQFNCMKIEVS